MCENKVLPVSGERILRTKIGKTNAASGFSGREQQTHFGIVAQRFKVSRALNGFLDRLFVYNAAGDPAPSTARRMPAAMAQPVRCRVAGSEQAANSSGLGTNPTSSSTAGHRSDRVT